VSLLLIVKVFEVFLTFFLKILTFAFSFLKGSAILPIYGVGILSFLLFEVTVLSRVFLFFSAKIVIQAAGHVNQVFLNIREFLYGYRVLNLYIQAFIELSHFGAIIPSHP